MAKSRSRKRKKKRVSFSLSTSKKAPRRKKTGKSLNFAGTLKILIVACVLGAVVVGFAFLEGYVIKAVPVSEKELEFELAEVPEWVNEDIKEKIYTAAIAGTDSTEPVESIAHLVQSNLENLIAWLDEVKVQATHDNIRITGRWRRPLALVSLGLQKCYVDAELIVLDFVPLSKCSTVKVQGLQKLSQLPAPGEVWQREDLAAAVAILERLDRMDQRVTPSKPLLYEIGRIDVSNFNGRQNSRFPHIVLYTKDNTEITWGAEVGSWQRYLESTDQQKLAKLYSYYMEYGSLLGDVKYINLQDPQETIPQPIDKY